MNLLAVDYVFNTCQLMHALHLSKKVNVTVFCLVFPKFSWNKMVIFS